MQPLMRLQSYNRTILELKCGNVRVKNVIYVSYNRTILELKCTHHFTQKKEIKNLQSHHIGIEILKQLFVTSWSDAYNRTILELKLTY